MLTRNTYAITAKVTDSRGLLASQIAGSEVDLSLTMTAAAGVFTSHAGPVNVTGRVSAIRGAPGLSSLLKLVGADAESAAFRGTHVLTGGDNQVIRLNLDGKAGLDLVVTFAGTGFTLTARADVTDRTYEWLVDDVEVEGTATLEKSEQVDDAVSIPGGGSTAWVPRADDGMIRGYMGSDLLADTGLASRHADLIRLRSAFTHLLVTADLQVPKGGQSSSGWMRPYVGHARTRTELTPLGRRNLELLQSYGFKVHLILFNTWALKHGYSENLGSTGGRDGVSEDSFAVEQLPFEKQFIANLMADPLTRSLDGIMPCLEASTAHAGGYCLAVAQLLREAGYAGTITADVIDSARTSSGSALKAAGVLLAPSLNSKGAWDAAGYDIRNSDGMTSATAGATDLLAHLVAHPGPMGYYIWVAGTVGNNGGRGAWPDSMLLALGAKQTSGGGGGTQPKPPVSNETPEQRTKRLYPGLALGDSRSGGNYDASGRPLPASNTTIWKPKSDSDGRLVIVCGHELPRIQHALIKRGDQVLDKAEYRGSVGNGWRLNLSGDRAGAAFGKGLTVVFVTDAGNTSFSIPDGSKRVELRVPMPTGGGGELPKPPTTPPVVTPPTVPSDPTQGALFFTTPNSLTLRDDFAACVGKIDVLANIHETAPGKVDMAKLQILTATRNGNTWTIPGDLSKYPTGNRSNTWRIRLTKTPPPPATQHFSIGQSFIRDGDNPYGPGNRTYPPTNRQ